MPNQKGKQEFKEEVKAILLESKSDKRVSQLRVLHWFVDGKDTGPMLEKRFWFVKEGRVTHGRRAGLNRTDCEYIAKNWNEISMFF